MKSIELEVQSRQETGRGANNRLRRTGQTPAVLYGPGKENVNLSVETRVLNKLITSHQEKSIINLKSSDSAVNGRHVLIKKWDRDILSRLPHHADFMEIDMTKEVRVKVQLNFVGKAKGVVEGGLVSHTVREIEVDCLPTAIPDAIEVDVTDLGVNDSIHIEELAVPEGVKKVFSDNYTIATCAVIKEEEVVAAAPAEGEEAKAAEPEVISKGKKDEEKKEGENK